MTPVSQTKLHDPDNGVKGNCFAACLASILELTLSDVPPLEEYDDDSWADVMLEFLDGRGLDIHMEKEPVSGYSIVNGLSSRGCGHSVVAQDGIVVHDPHPSREGLVEIHCYLYITGIEES